MPSSDELLTRAVAKVIPADLAKKKIASGKKLRVYWGIDPTGGKIHLGHTVPMRRLKAFADAGHEVILIIGSFTAMIGDPSDRDSLRQPLTREQVEENFRTYKVQASKVLDFSKVKIQYNHEWLEKLRFEEIIKLAGNFTVQQMSERAMFAERMSNNKPVFVHEFMYPLMVGYDSVVLDVDCEIGGSDQEFNMLAGRTLQHAFGKREKFVLTTPLIEGTDGRKMSKTYGNCIFLDDEPGDMYGKVMSMKDELITIYMECCTDISMKEIEETKKAMRKEANPRDFKMRLAREIVTMYHGADAAKAAETQFHHVFAEHGLPDHVPEARVKKGTLLIDVIVKYKLAPSKSEARRLIEQGGVKIDNVSVLSVEAPVAGGKKAIIVRVGKRKFLKIILS